MSALTWRIPARLTVSGPTGWVPVERVEVVRVDGAAQVSVETWPVVGMDIDDFAKEHASSLAATRAGWSGLGIEVATVMGCEDGRTRRGTWLDADGSPVDVTIGYRLDPDVAFVVTSVRRADDESAVKDAQAIVASIAAVSVLRAEPVRPEAAPSRPDVVGSDWDDLRVSWARETKVASSGQGHSELTFEEALAAAAHHGAVGFPGVDARFLNALEPALASVVLQVAWRSVEARAGTEPDLTRQLELATNHDVLVVREHMNSVNARLVWLAARPDGVVVLEPDVDARRVSIGGADAEDLVELLLADLDAASGAGRGDARHIVTTPAALVTLLRGDLDRGEHPELAPLADGLSGFTRVRTIYRHSGRIAGGEVEWLDAGATGIWLIDRGDAAVTMSSIDRPGIRSALLAALPGSAPAHRVGHEPEATAAR